MKEADHPGSTDIMSKASEPAARLICPRRNAHTMEQYHTVSRREASTCSGGKGRQIFVDQDNQVVDILPTLIHDYL